NIDQPEIAGQLGERKAGSIIDTGADIVASGNIGCLTQLETHLNRQGSTIRVLHTMQVLRDAIRGRSLGGN
ncbi:MAG: 2-hydroxy-acid oxidase, partial [Planctomycetota bacterium]